MPLAGVELLQAIGARARPAGSESERLARELCTNELRDAGFSVVDRPFEYSAFPGLWGTHLVGVMLLAAGLVVALGRADATIGVVFAPMVGLLMALAAGVIGWWLARYGSGSMRVMLRCGVNLEASRGVPTVWLVAHLDTKSQPVSLLLRAAGVLITCLSWCVLVVGSVGVLAGVVRQGAVAPLGWVAAAGAVPLLLSWVRRDRGGTSYSTGALDNASGVVTVLRAASIMKRELPIGVILTSGEELGLVGARAWLAERHGLGKRHGLARGVAINCDGIDDIGAVTCTIARDGGVFRSSVEGVVRGVPFAQPVGVRRSLPGVLFDAVAFADAGWAAATVSRGTLGSLARVHTRGDTLDRMNGAGVEESAQFLAALAGSIIAGQHAGDPGAEEQKTNGSTDDGRWHERP